MGEIPAGVHYRPAPDADKECATCAFFTAGSCSKFDAAVSPSYTCDRWKVIPVATVKAPPVAHHNRVLAAAHARTDELEEKLVGVLSPILRAAGAEAARRFSANVTDHLTASALRRADIDAVARTPHAARASLRPWLALTAAGGLGGVRANSTMICVKPRPEEADAIADPDGTSPESLHVTLVSLGGIDGDLASLADALRTVAASHAPLSGVVGGYGRFQPPGCGILLPDVPGLVELRVAVTDALVAAEIDYARNHGYQPHLTVDGDPEPGEAEMMLERAAQAPLHFDSLLIVRGDAETIEIPLTGRPPLTAAGQPGDPPPWTAPAADELIDVDRLVAKLRTKTDPVRRAVVESVAGASLEAAGIKFDVTNPLIGAQIAQAGRNVESIAATTRINLMRIIHASYNQGLSIPDTAKAIRVGMAEAAPDRARLIARTELAGAVNGSSLAAVQVVQDATDQTYTKIWMTAPGAKYPRHDDYDDLDGQEATLDDFFDVGGAQLQHPGDPDGPPEEICNCFPAETLVEMPSLRAAMRRWYEGDLVRVRLASGDVLAATPNHPVLRADGQWMPLCKIKEGDDLVSARLAWDETGAPDPNRPPAEIGETYRLASSAATPERIRLRPPDLHGDGTNGKVNVVTLDGTLLLDVEAASDEQVEEFGLALASSARSRAGGSDGTLGMFDGAGDHFSWSSAFGVSPASQRASLFVAHSLHPDPVRLGSAAHGKPEFAESSGNGRTADVEMLTDCEDAVAALVTLTKVVKVEVEPFHGYVYNLDTGLGWYTASTVACRNCRCTMSYSDGSEAPQEDTGE